MTREHCWHLYIYKHPTGSEPTLLRDNVVPMSASYKELQAALEKEARREFTTRYLSWELVKDITNMQTILAMYVRAENGECLELR